MKKNWVAFPLKQQLLLREGLQGKVTRDKFIHCIIHKQAAKWLKPEEHRMLQDATFVNLIKIKSL